VINYERRFEPPIWGRHVDIGPELKVADLTAKETRNDLLEAFKASISTDMSASVYKSSPTRREPAFATIGRIRPEISQGAVRISDDLKTGPEIRWKTLIEEVQLRRPESINFAGMLGELGIEHGHQVFGGVIL
jgi:hypothetical protein